MGVGTRAEAAVLRDLDKQLVDLIPRLRRFSRGLTGNREQGDELVQAACERLLRHQSRLRADTRLDSWLFRVIRNLHVDSIRAQAVRDRTAQTVRQEARTREEGIDTLHDHLTVHEVQRAMLRLSEEHRSALMLVCVEGLSYREAAEVLQVPMGTVTSRLTRARKALIAQMAGDDGRIDREACNER